MTLQDAPVQALRAPFPWFGGKSGAAPIIWRLLGNPTNYVEPFAGSLAALLGRPAHHLTSPRTETVNDLDGYLANFWRALRLDSDGVADWCIAPVNEIDLTARHRWLCERERKAAFLARMEADPDFCDPKIAGWWVWGLAAWIGTGWCSGIWDAENARGVAHQLPQLSNGGGGVHRKLPQMGPAGARGGQLEAPADGPGRGTGSADPMDPTNVRGMLYALAVRLRTVRVACGDWTRILSPTCIGLTSHCSGAGILLDPPYVEGDMTYATGADVSVARDVAAWAFAHGDNPALRIVLCGYEGHYDLPSGWTSIPWSKERGGGYENQSGKGSQRRERLFASPHCLPLDDGRML